MDGDGNVLGHRQETVRTETACPAGKDPKQIPLPYRIEQVGHVTEYFCPRCGTMYLLRFGAANYCENCGQALKLEDGEKEPMMGRESPEAKEGGEKK